MNKKNQVTLLICCLTLHFNVMQFHGSSWTAFSGNGISWLISSGHNCSGSRVFNCLAKVLLPNMVLLGPQINVLLWSLIVL